MLDRNYFSVLFFIKKTKLLKNREAPICLRITVNKKRAEVQIKRSVPVNKWDAKKECCKAKDKSGEELNHYLLSVKTKVLRIHRELEQDNKPITAEIIKKRFYGEYIPPKMLLEVFNEHNKRCRELIGKDYVEKVVQRYERTVTYLQEFMKASYKISDIPFNSINTAFIVEFEHFLKTEKSCAQNTTVKYIKNLKKITNYAAANRWMESAPFTGVKLRQEKTNRDFLVEEELTRIIEKDFENPRLMLIKDIFVFCSFTGLAFSDVQGLKQHHIFRDNEGAYWIRKTRVKTDIMCNIPLMDIPLKLIEKYRSNPECEIYNKVFPVPSNQKMNEYLKEIASICNIDKNLSTHIARHTFACLALANNISIESIAKMLGHTSTRTTAIYARVLDSTLKNQMESLRKKFAVNA
ncbi:site-specific recombinase XerD [Dysgonomonas alginatilytica]|uniref:Site-specific recombinase XerD n=2 Tax=Dysgonomonas alginatilytica TaxID=1605892 RepID=A0A2V3PTJ6_9BACT|nr:site-specific recombinase XerD [Dysgonomonas alginatilytica]